MITTFIGIDLAWKSQRNQTGVAVLKGDRRGALLEVSQLVGPGDSVADFITTHATASTVVAIDAPLIIVNQTGQRACETAIGKRYGSRDASCHTSNLGLYPEASSAALTEQLLAQGFSHVDSKATQQQDRIIMEVYPHAAMVELWNLKKTIKYKKGSVAAKRVGLTRLRTRLMGLCNAEPPLLRAGGLMELLATNLNDLVGRKAKAHEDQLDALFCAYLAYYSWYWGWEQNEMFGDIESGYILNPKLPSLDAKPTASNQPIVQTAPLETASPENHNFKLETLNLRPDSYATLIAQAHDLARPIKPSSDCSAASVASVIVSRSGKTYTGVCLEFSCSLGFCAEHAAIAEMLKAHESEIAIIVAVDEHGEVLAPCGRCREMMWQLNPTNRDALVILAPDRARPLDELLPER